MEVFELNSHFYELWDEFPNMKYSWKVNKKPNIVPLRTFEINEKLVDVSEDSEFNRDVILEIDGSLSDRAYELLMSCSARANKMLGISTSIKANHIRKSRIAIVGAALSSKVSRIEFSYVKYFKSGDPDKYEQVL